MTELLRLETIDDLPLSLFIKQPKVVANELGDFRITDDAPIRFDQLIVSDNRVHLKTRSYDC